MGRFQPITTLHLMPFQQSHFTRSQSNNYDSKKKKQNKTNQHKKQQTLSNAYYCKIAMHYFRFISN